MPSFFFIYVVISSNLILSLVWLLVKTRSDMWRILRETRSRQHSAHLSRIAVLTGRIAELEEETSELERMMDRDGDGSNGQKPPLPGAAERAGNPGLKLTTFAGGSASGGRGRARLSVVRSSENDTEN